MIKITCSRCNSQWTGSGRCHCSACCITFGGLVSFDIHRRGYKCASPVEMGLVEKLGVWIKEYANEEEE